MRAAPDALRSGPPELRRATIALAITQLISWGALYYAFAVVAPAMAGQSGWGITAVSGAFSVGLLSSGLSAPLVAAMLGRYGPRAVMTTGSLLQIVAMTLWAASSSVAMLYAAWILMGLAMAGTLYEPAIVVLAVLDARRMRDTIATVTVAGGLASAVWVPLTHYLIEALDWRAAVAVLGGVSGAATAVLHARYLPAHLPAQQDSPRSAPPRAHTHAIRWLRLAYFLEQGSAVAATALLVTMLIDRGVQPQLAGLVLASSGVGKVAGRMLLAGRIGGAAPARIAAGATALNAIAMLSMLAVTSTPWLYATGLASGAAAGSSSVLRPLIVAAYSPLSAFAATNARLQFSATFARALGPIVIASTASHAGWTGGWVLLVAGLLAAAAVYAALGGDRGVSGSSQLVAQ